MARRRSLMSVLLVLPGALLIVLGVLGCNRDAVSLLGYDGLIEAGVTETRP